MAVRVLLILAVFGALYGCGQPSAPPEQPENESAENAAVEPTPTPAPTPETTMLAKPEYTSPEPTSSATASAQATGIQPTPEFYAWQCRGDTYAAEQGMSQAEYDAFGTEMGNRLADDIEAGGNKDMNDILDDMGVPSYPDECG